MRDDKIIEQSDELHMCQMNWAIHSCYFLGDVFLGDTRRGVICGEVHTSLLCGVFLGEDHFGGGLPCVRFSFLFAPADGVLHVV